MERIAFYGKGGIGKSTVAAGVSLALARQGKRVLHVGCDPKHDSTLALVSGPVRTVIDQIFSQPVGSLKREHLIMQGRQGIDCIESGGPESGVGCGGRAVSRMFELFEELNVVDQDRYDVAVFDVLGDVVCGGFAAPLRSAFAPKVVIVSSEEMAAGYAANNIARGVQHYLDNGVTLAGVVLNRRDNQADVAPIQRLIEALNSKVLAVLRRDPRVGEAELNGRSIVEAEPGSPVAQALVKLSKELLTIAPKDCPVPRPMELDRIRQVMLGGG